MNSSVTSLYIHIPFCLSKCSYCDFFSVPVNKAVPDEYVNALCNEIQYRFNQYDVKFLKTIYIGGGTPSLLSKNQLKKIFDAIKAVEISPCAEITIEVNPDDISDDKLELYNEVGINRISCGIQSFNDASLKSVGRRADRKRNITALKILKDVWNKKYKKNFSVDLICGLPYETSATFNWGIKKIIKFHPAHISVYTLVLDEDTKLGKFYLDNDSYDYDYTDKIWIKCKNYLHRKKYFQYEVSNFSKKGFECSHNLVYWSHESYLGCGSGATGTVYSDDGSAERISNIKDLRFYTSYWNNQENNEIPQYIEAIGVKDSKFEFFMMGLRKASGISDSDYKKMFKENLSEKVIMLFEKWQKNRMCEIILDGKDVIYRMTEMGMLYLNRFLEELEI